MCTARPQPVLPTLILEDVVQKVPTDGVDYKFLYATVLKQNVWRKLMYIFNILLQSEPARNYCRLRRLFNDYFLTLISN